MIHYKLLCAVVNLGAASHVIKVARKYGVQGATVSIGHGSGGDHSRLSDILGLIDERKEIIEMITDEETASKAAEGVCGDMKMRKPHHGIAFTVSLSEFNAHINTETSEVKDKMYQIINVIVDKGMAQDVIDAAKKAGARGGTIVNARGAGGEETHKLFSVEIEPEKEKVFLIVKSELKNAVVESVKNRLNLDGQSGGILYVMNIDEVYGLHE